MRSESPHAQAQADAAAAWRSVVPALAGTPHVRTSQDGGRTFPAKHARPLPPEPPADRPCTVPVYDAAASSGRMLVLDLDPSRAAKPGCQNAAPGGERLTADLDGQALALGQLLGRLGVRYLADVAPSGGRHVYVLFSSLLPWLELRDLCRAVALRFPAVDPAPMAGLGGQISPPGSRHKSGGWRTLTPPLSEAVAIVGHPNGPEAWAALLDEFAAELRAGEIRTPVRDSGAGIHEEAHGFRAELDDAGVPWVPRLGGRANLGAELAAAARTGRSPGRGRSEARMAILASAAARGWRLADVLEAVSSGAWKGFPGLYCRASEPGRMERLLPQEWRKAVAFVSGEENVRGWHTSDLSTRPPVSADGPSAEYGLIRMWMTVTGIALEDPERVRGWGGRVIGVRLVLLALGQAAMVSGSSVVEFGCRQLSLYSCVSHRTVARVLRMLAAEDDPLIDLVSPGRQARADRYQLRIPDMYAASAQWRRRRAGRIEAVHHAFLVLGPVAGLVHQVLDGSEARGAEVARAARLSPSATSAALRVLAEHGLAERGRGGWRRGPASLDDIAASTGAADLHRERAERYKQDRISWRARLAQYASARNAVVSPGDGWLSLDDEQEWEALLFGRWPVLGEDFVRGPPSRQLPELGHTG